MMPRYFSLAWTLFFLVVNSYVLWLWIRSAKSAREISPRWRVIVVLAGLFSATASMILCDFLFVHAAYTGGYMFYHPVELFCIRMGGLTALLGIVASIIGRGRLRFHVAAISALGLLMWFADATFQ